MRPNKGMKLTKPSHFGASQLTQTEYDLIAARGEELLKVSVKGSQDGSWGLCQSHMKPKQADYHGAIQRWLGRHKERTVLCFVQFKDVAVNEMPRVWVATPQEVAQRLRETANGRGDTILYERHQWTARARGAGTVEEISESWRFSRDGVQHLFSAA